MNIDTEQCSYCGKPEADPDHTNGLRCCMSCCCIMGELAKASPLAYKWAGTNLERLAHIVASLEARVKRVEAEYKAANPQRNKWNMLCNHFGYNPQESCVATISDRLEKAECNHAS